MNTFKTAILRAALALGVAAGLALPAAASPMYHVTIDTSAVSGATGYLDFLMTSLDDASPVYATISNISVPSAGAPIVNGEVDLSRSPAVKIGNNVTDPYGNDSSEFGQAVRFGANLSFDIAFDFSAFTTNPYTKVLNTGGTALQVALIDASGFYIGPQADAVDFDLLYGQDPGITPLAGITQVTSADTSAQVPEAPALMLSMTGLGLLGALRRRSSRTRTRAGAAHALTQAA